MKLSSSFVMDIASNIQKCNVKIVNIIHASAHSQDSAAPFLSPSAATEKLETGCVVVIAVNYQQLLRALKFPLRRKMKPCLTVLQNSHHRAVSFLSQVELAIDKMLVANCSSCNNQTLCSFETTTVKGDQPLHKKSGRYVYLNDRACVEQDGVYYGHYFVPDKRGKLLGWFSSPASAPKQLSARVCCLLNSLNLFIGDGHGIIKRFDILNNPPDRIFLGPLGQNCLKQCELEPVLVFVKL